jgi:ribosomal-protein-alanine N-acetyltransferase
MNLKTIPFPQLETGRLTLRRLAMSDIERLLMLRCDDRVNQYLNRPKTMNIEEAKAFIKKIDGLLNNNISLYWVLSFKDADELIGTICLWNFVPENDAADIGYEMLPKYQGKGLMREAVKKIIEYGFETVELKVITGLTHAENKSSMALLEKVGFKPDADNVYVSKEEAEGDAVFYLLKV